MQTCPTIRVKPWGKGQGDFVEINESDFDPKVHVKYDGPAVATGGTGNAPSGDAGPDFDGMKKAELAEYLAEAGVDFETDANKPVLLELAKAHFAKTQEK